MWNCLVARHLSQLGLFMLLITIPELNEAPTLSHGSVIPNDGNRNTELRFIVRYSDADNDAPEEIKLKIDDSIPKNMCPVDSKDTGYFDGAEYEYKTKLVLGSYTYSFGAKDWKDLAIGDIEYLGQQIGKGQDPNPDVNGDGMVDIMDLVIISKNLGK